MSASRLEEKLAQRIRDAFERIRIHVMLSPTDFRAVTGYWRKQDVYRWQIYIEALHGEHWRMVEVSSWDTMTLCAQRGIEIHGEDLSGFGYEVSALPGRKKKEPTT